MLSSCPPAPQPVVERYCEKWISSVSKGLQSGSFFFRLTVATLDKPSECWKQRRSPYDSVEEDFEKSLFVPAERPTDRFSTEFAFVVPDGSLDLLESPYERSVNYQTAPIYTRRPRPLRQDRRSTSCRKKSEAHTTGLERFSRIRTVSCT